MLNKNIAITTNWEIRLTDEQEQLACREAEKVLCSWKGVNSIVDIDITSFDEVDWEDAVVEAIHTSKIYSYYEDLNEVIFFKTNDTYTTDFDLDRLPYDVYRQFYNHMCKVVKKYIIKRNAGVL